MRGLRKFLQPLVVASVAFVTAGSAFAQSTCTQLEAALVSLDRSGAGAAAANYQRLDGAYNQKRFELDQAVAAARAGNCTGLRSIFNRPAQNCPSLERRVGQLQGELASIGAERQRYSSDPGAVNRQRYALLQALGNNNCGPQYAAYAGNAAGFANAFGNRGVPNGLEPPSVGTYRTLCVRTCDGYYFPISFSTVRSQFGTDQQVCQAMCPAAEVALYVHRNPGQESQDMVSLTGERYASLPTAFLYRSEYNPSCTCRSGAARTTASTTYYPSVDAALAALRSSSRSSAEPGVPVPVPLPKPSASEDPETLANWFGGLVPVPTAPRPPEDDAVNVALTGAANVRVVGPPFYYALSAAEEAGPDRTATP